MELSLNSLTRTGIGWSTFPIVAMSRAPAESSNDERRLNLARKLYQRQVFVLSVSSSPYRSDILSAYTPIVDKIEALLRRQTQAVKSKLGKSAKVTKQR